MSENASKAAWSCIIKRLSELKPYPSPSVVSDFFIFLLVRDTHVRRSLDRGKLRFLFISVMIQHFTILNHIRNHYVEPLLISALSDSFANRAPHRNCQLTCIS